MTDSEILKELRTIIERRAHKHFLEHQRTDYNFGCRSAYLTLLDDLKKLKEDPDDRKT